MDQDVQLGRIIEDERPGRDAIHIAVVAVTSKGYLSPGQPVELVHGSHTEVRASHGGIGIVDPFLPHPPVPGDHFWVCLYPYTITSLRHEWVHPAFEEGRSKEASEQWLRAFVARSDCPGYEAVIAAALGQGARSWDDEFLHFDGMDAHGDIPPEFWDHVEIVTGSTIEPARRASHFSCSC